MMKIPKFVIAGVVGLALATGFAQPASAATLGGVNVLSYCQSQFGVKALVGTHVNTGDAYSWRCTYLGVTLPYGMDMNQACRYSYANPRAYAALADRRNPYSWSCRV